MKHHLSVFAIILLLGSSALWFTSCASDEIKSPQPPATVLKSEPVMAADTSEPAPAHSTAPSTSSNVTKYLNPSHKALVAASAVIAASGNVPSADSGTVNLPPDSIVSGNGWLLFLLLLALLLLMVMIYRYQAHHRREKGIRMKQSGELALAQQTGLTDEGLFFQGSKMTPVPVSAKKARWFPVMATSKAEKEIAITVFYHGREHKMHFSPSATVKKVTAWAAYQCGIFDLNTTEVYLAIQGYSAPLTGTAHIGRFMMRDKHHLELDVLTFVKNAPPVPEVVSVKKLPLAKNEILVEGAGMTQAVKIEVKPQTPLKEIIGSVARIGSFPSENAFIFLENESNPLNPNLPLDAKHPRHKVHHVHTQMEIVITVFFNGREHQMHFSPATTVHKVAAWASYQFEIFDQDAAEVYLAIHGYSAPLTGTAHIGRFVEHDKNNLELDLLTFTKVAT